MAEMPYLGVGYDVFYTPKKINKGMYGSQGRRRSLYAQKSIAARRIQTSYRRRRQPGNTDQRQLAAVVRSYRKANPYQITPSSGRTVTFWRKTQVSVAINQLSGFASTSFNVNWGFTLGRIVGYLGGVFSYSLPVSNAAEFQSLFDYYIIRSVKMQIFYSKTEADFSSGASQAMPLLLLANDFDDIAEPMSLSSMNERVGCRHAQFDGSNTRGINHYIKPKPTSTIVQTNPDTGVISSANAGVVFGTQWIDCAQSNIVHHGIKVYYDNQGRSSNVDLGTISFVFDVEYCFKGYR